MIRVGIAILAFLVLLLALIHFFFKSATNIAYSVDLGSLIDALVWVFIGVLIEFVYSKQSSDKRADTELLLRVVDEAKEAFRKLVEKSELCESDKALSRTQQVELTCADRELSNAIHSLESALTYCKVKLDRLNFEALKSALFELKESLTDSPYPGPYDQAARIRIRSAKRAVRNELTRVGFAINRR